MNILKFGKNPLFENNKLIVIGDIHGNDIALFSLWDKISSYLNKGYNYVFVGDICNIGLNSPIVFEFLRDLKEKYPNQIYLIRGNHEYMLEVSLRGSQDWIKYVQPTFDQFKEYYNLANSNYSTIQSLFIDEGYQDFLLKMIPYYETDEVIISHAPLDYTVCLTYGLEDYVNPEDIEEDHSGLNFSSYFLEKIGYQLLWGFTDESGPLLQIKEIDKYLICGHQFMQHTKPVILDHRCFLDTGCSYNFNNPLTALEYPSKKYFQSK